MSMNDTDSARAGYIRERRTGMAAIATAMPVALLLWLAIAYLAPPLAGMDSLSGRMLFTLKCSCLAVLFCLVTGRSAAMRGLGAPGMALSMIVLLYVASRIGYEVGGITAAAVPVVAFLAIEACLFRATRSLPPT